MSGLRGLPYIVVLERPDALREYVVAMLMKKSLQKLLSKFQPQLALNRLQDLLLIPGLRPIQRAYCEPIASRVQAER